MKRKLDAISSGIQLPNDIKVLIFNHLPLTQIQKLRGKGVLPPKYLQRRLCTKWGGVWELKVKDPMNNYLIIAGYNYNESGYGSEAFLPLNRCLYNCIVQKDIDGIHYFKKRFKVIPIELRRYSLDLEIRKSLILGPIKNLYDKIAHDYSKIDDDNFLIANDFYASKYLELSKISNPDPKGLIASRDPQKIGLGKKKLGPNALPDLVKLDIPELIEEDNLKVIVLAVRSGAIEILKSVLEKQKVIMDLNRYHHLHGLELFIIPQYLDLEVNIASKMVELLLPYIRLEVIKNLVLSLYLLLGDPKINDLNTRDYNLQHLIIRYGHYHLLTKNNQKIQFSNLIEFDKEKVLYKLKYNIVPGDLSILASPDFFREILQLVTSNEGKLYNLLQLSNFFTLLQSPFLQI